MITKYRIFNKVENKYVEDVIADDFHRTLCQPAIIPDGKLVALYYDEIYDVLPNTYLVEYSTGLLDTNKIEIFDGDIIKKENIYYKYYEKVYYDRELARWCVGENDTLSNIINLEVVGNIHQNRELLNEGTEY
ncbi:YopX family protein [Staphylococcus pseudintermedius]